jgi:hypothetical protein
VNRPSFYTALAGSSFENKVISAKLAGVSTMQGLDFGYKFIVI